MKNPERKILEGAEAHKKGTSDWKLEISDW